MALLVEKQPILSTDVMYRYISTRGLRTHGRLFASSLLQRRKDGVVITRQSSVEDVVRGSDASRNIKSTQDCAQVRELRRGSCAYDVYTIGRVQVANRSSYPNRAPKKPFDDDSFLSASATSCKAFCSLSAISTVINDYVSPIVFFFPRMRNPLKRPDSSTATQ